MFLGIEFLSRLVTLNCAKQGSVKIRKRSRPKIFMFTAQSLDKRSTNHLAYPTVDYPGFLPGRYLETHQGPWSAHRRSRWRTGTRRYSLAAPRKIWLILPLSIWKLMPP